MIVNLHKKARTTPEIRREIQASTLSEQLPPISTPQKISNRLCTDISTSIIATFHNGLWVIKHPSKRSRCGIKNGQMYIKNRLIFTRDLTLLKYPANHSAENCEFLHLVRENDLMSFSKTSRAII